MPRVNLSIPEGDDTWQLAEEGARIESERSGRYVSASAWTLQAIRERYERMGQRWAIQQEQGGEWVTLQERESEEEARTGAQALRTLAQMGLHPDVAVRIWPVDAKA